MTSGTANGVNNRKVKCERLIWFSAYKFIGSIKFYECRTNRTSTRRQQSNWLLPHVITYVHQCMAWIKVIQMNWTWERAKTNFHKTTQAHAESQHVWHMSFFLQLCPQLLARAEPPRRLNDDQIVHNAMPFNIEMRKFVFQYFWFTFGLRETSHFGRISVNWRKKKNVPKVKRFNVFWRMRPKKLLTHSGLYCIRVLVARDARPVCSGKVSERE